MSYIYPGGMMALAVSFMNLTTIVFISRAITVRTKGWEFGLDDGALLISWILCTAMCINMITAVAYGVWGVPLMSSLEMLDSDGMPDLTALNSWALSAANKFAYIHENIFVLQATFSKLAIVFFYRRTLITRGSRSITHWSTIVTIALIALWGTGFFFAEVFQCGSQFALIWDGPVLLEAEMCVSIKVELAQAISDVLLDIIIAIIPIYPILSLQLSLAKKVQVLSAFIIGALSLAGASVRLAAYGSAFSGIDNEFNQQNAAMLTSTFMYWAMFESGFALITACLPGLRPLLNKMAGAAGHTFATFREKSLRSNPNASEDPESSNIKVSYEVHVTSVARD